MIKVAIISDIHGNMNALTNVIADINKQNIKRILILGDLALMGSEPNETINFIRNLEHNYDIDIIQGNTDLFIVNENLPNVPDFAKNAIIYAKNTISSDNIIFLKILPEQKSLKIGKTTILMTHGSPRKNDENIFPGKNIEEIRPMIKNSTETIILCGHTHLPAGYQIDKQTVINVGSVGRPFTENQKACYAILEIDENKKDTFSVEHKFINFDVQNEADKLSKLNFEGAKYLAQKLLESRA